MPGLQGGQRGRNGDDSPRALRRDPRVVIFEGPDGPLVEVVELPPVTSVGARICHRGTFWQVTGFRTHRRVVICRPAEA